MSVNVINGIASHSITLTQCSDAQDIVVWLGLEKVKMNTNEQKKKSSLCPPLMKILFCIFCNECCQFKLLTVFCVMVVFD